MDPVGFEFVEVLSANRVIFREAENGFLFALRLFLFERKSFTHGLRVANAALFAEAESVLSLKGSCVCEANEAPFQRNEGCTFDAERLYQLSYRPIIYIGKIYEVDYGPRGSKPLK